MISALLNIVPENWVNWKRLKQFHLSRHLYVSFVRVSRRNWKDGEPCRGTHVYTAANESEYWVEFDWCRTWRIHEAAVLTGWVRRCTHETATSWWIENLTSRVSEYESIIAGGSSHHRSQMLFHINHIIRHSKPRSLSVRTYVRMQGLVLPHWPCLIAVCVAIMTYCGVRNKLQVSLQWVTSIGLLSHERHGHRHGQLCDVSTIFGCHFIRNLPRRVMRSSLWMLLMLLLLLSLLLLWHCKSNRANARNHLLCSAVAYSWDAQRQWNIWFLWRQGLCSFPRRGITRSSRHDEKTFRTKCLRLKIQ